MATPPKINAVVDSVIMLASSKWKKDLRDHSYDYVLRVAKHLPVIVIQPDLDEPSFAYESTELENVFILHIFHDYDSTLQIDLIARALNLKYIISPLLWICNPLFIKYIEQAYSPCKICYVSEDYLTPEFFINQFPKQFLNSSVEVLNLVDEIVCISPWVRDSIINKNIKWQGKARVITNTLDDGKFTDLIEGKNLHIAKREQLLPAKLNVLVLYESKSLMTNTTRDHLYSYGRFSSHNIFYASATEDNNEVKSLSNFDAVIIHYSLRLSVCSGNWTLSEEVVNLIKDYVGLKVAFLQDEYETTNTTISRLKSLGVQIVFTCVPEESLRKIYSENSLPSVQFVNNLTGYVPEDLIDYPVPPIAARKKIIAYRGRSLPYWYGNLGQEKGLIGIKMKEICLKRGIQEDIEWDDTKRIYGEDWYTFLTSAKATLGTESGANVFDYTGDLRRNISDYLNQSPNANYHEVFDIFLREHEDLIKMNQVSPKIFEAICLHTALILFEGDYSGVLEPNIHYIPLKKDFSNIDDVLAKVEDDDFLIQLTDRAYKDIVLSGKYSYKSFVFLVDETLRYK